ncbi:MAG: family 43 glycosylhydrolase [Paludibacteraceae bacterium]
MTISLENNWGAAGEKLTILIPTLKTSDSINTQVFFGNAKASILSVNPPHLNVMVPESSISKVNVTVKILDMISNSVAFNYITKYPKINTITLRHRAIPGDTLVISGENFYAIGNKVLFSGNTVNVTSENSKEIKLIIPQNVSNVENIVVYCGSLSSNTVSFNFSVYSNPIYNHIADPTVIKANDGYFYAYATENAGLVPIIKSKDLVSWSACGSVFNTGTYPTFNTGNVWAPDINYFNGKYVLYFSMSTWGGTWAAGIGVSTADKPEGPFSIGKKMFISSEINVENSIDPCFVEANGKKYLFWGSFKGIYTVELEDDGLSVKSGAEKILIAGTAFEGTYIYRRGDYYYLFASIGSCCNGLSSTYKTVVGRSKNLFGPYLNKKGNSMNNNAYEIVIKGNDNFVGTGHNSEILTDDDGNDWILFHAYDAKYPDEGRKLMLEKITWTDDGWPTVNDGKNVPRVSATKPYFQ